MVEKYTKLRDPDPSLGYLIMYLFIYLLLVPSFRFLDYIVIGRYASVCLACQDKANMLLDIVFISLLLYLPLGGEVALAMTQ